MRLDEWGVWDDGVDDVREDDKGRYVTRLSFAARTGTLSEVCSLCDAGADVNYAYEWDGWDFGMKVYASPLMEAANRGDVDIVRELLQRGASVEAFMCDTDPRSSVSQGWHTEGWTMLMSAVSSTCLDVVKLILEQGVDVNARAERSQYVDRLGNFEDCETVTALSLARTLKLDAIAALLAVQTQEAAKAAAAIETLEPAVPPATVTATMGQSKRLAEAAQDAEELDQPVSKRTRGAVTADATSS